MDDIASLLHVPKLPSHIARVERQLNDCFVSVHPAIAGPALRLIGGRAKRLRPMLVIAVAASQGADITKDVITAATAIELAHLSSLVHDDLLDNADLRGGVPTIHTTEGIGSAILVGDYMLAAAVREASSVNAAVGTTVADAIMQMCEGQIQESADTYNVKRSIGDYRSCIHKKTAVLISAACQVGGLCADGPAASVKIFGNYGEAFGVAYQLVDDLLDFLATAETMGKPVHNDIKEGVYSLPLLLSLAGPSGASVRSWLGKEPEHTVAYSVIVDRLKRDGSFEETLKEIKKQNTQAIGALQGLHQNVIVKGLSQLPELYLSSALDKQTVLARSV